MIVSSNLMLKKAKEKKYAIGAFNVENYEMIRAVIEVADEYKSPIIIASSTNSLKYAKPTTISGIVNSVGSNKSIPIALHLDHGDSIELVAKCIDAGYTSIMFDGSHLSYKENIDLTTKVANLCHLFNIPLEGELGAIGGKADAENIDLSYTHPDTAFDFVSKTNIDSLAVAIGTAHGFYKTKPKLDYARCNEIRNILLETPLVLHGASGLLSEQISNCIDNGICKINYATELRQAYTEAIKRYIENNPNNIDPKKYGLAAISAVKEVVLSKFQDLNSIGRALELNPKLVVFDFDGLIVNSETIYQDCWEKALNKNGIKLSQEQLLSLRSCDSSVAKELFPDEYSYDMVRKNRKELMSEYGVNKFFELKHGIRDSLSWLKHNGFKTIVVSSSNIDIIESHLKYYKIYDLFDNVFSVKGEIKRGKPFPDIYFKIAEKYKVKPEEILVFEDSPNGIRASKKAGCLTVMIPDISMPNDGDLNFVDCVLPSANYISNIFK